ncbi:hypothetical protein V6N12_029493 [Hibiscus sabdariffa]|uniref:Uncharacterized protein n=1 Tax=Hibiscus sabdariffa TaxID=183260 RepID=A0ABR2CW95_9ROSI
MIPIAQALPPIEFCTMFHSNEANQTGRNRSTGSNPGVLMVLLYSQGWSATNLPRCLEENSRSPILRLGKRWPMREASQLAKEARSPA